MQKIYRCWIGDAPPKLHTGVLKIGGNQPGVFISREDCKKLLWIVRESKAQGPLIDTLKIACKEAIGVDDGHQKDSYI